MSSAKPSLALLREISDEAVLRALMERRQLTRAELAVVTGLSKPTTGEAIRRLESAGLVRDTGERTTGRGGVGTFYALAEDAGCALAVVIAPGAVVVEVLHPEGTVVTRSVRPVTRRATANLVSEALAGAAREALGARRAQVAAVSAADPVDKVTGELVHLPDAPFLLGAMSPPTTLEPFVDGSVSVDNDVNWAAGAERAARADGGSDDFVYLYLGEGLGCAVVSDGQVRRGHRGLAGEIAHVTVPGPDGGAMPLIALFGRLGLRHPSSTAIDVDRLLAALAAREGADLGRILAAAVAAALDAAVAFADPAFVVAGGPWASAPQFAQQLGEAVARRPRPVRLESPRLGADAPLHGARAAAVEELRRRIVARSRSSR